MWVSPLRCTKTHLTLGLRCLKCQFAERRTEMNYERPQNQFCTLHNTARDIPGFISTRLMTDEDKQPSSCLISSCLLFQTAVESWQRTTRDAFAKARKLNPDTARKWCGSLDRFPAEGCQHLNVSANHTAHPKQHNLFPHIVLRDAHLPQKVTLHTHRERVKLLWNIYGSLTLCVTS